MPGTELYIDKAAAAASHHLGKCIHLSGVKTEFAAPEEELSEGREL